MTIALRPSVGVANIKLFTLSVGNIALDSSRDIAAIVAVATKGAVFGLAGVVLVDLSLSGISWRSWNLKLQERNIPLPAQHPTIGIDKCESGYCGPNYSPVHLLKLE